ERRIEIELPRPAAFDLRALRKRCLDSAQDLTRIAASAVDQPARQALRVVEQDFQQMFGCELLVPFAQGERLGGLHETAGAVCVFLEIHTSLPRPVPAAPQAQPKHRHWVFAAGFQRHPTSTIWEPSRFRERGYAGFSWPSCAFAGLR